MYELHTTRRIEFADTDMAGLVHFARFFVFMETAEHAFLRAAGAPGLPAYSGQYDDLLYYYSYQYETVQRVYRERFSAAAAGAGEPGPDGAPTSQRPIDSAEAESLAGVPPARLPAALSLLRRHRAVDQGTGDEIRGESAAVDTLASGSSAEQK